MLMTSKYKFELEQCDWGSEFSLGNAATPAPNMASVTSYVVSMGERVDSDLVL